MHAPNCQNERCPLEKISMRPPAIEAIDPGTTVTKNRLLCRISYQHSEKSIGECLPQGTRQWKRTDAVT